MEKAKRKLFGDINTVEKIVLGLFALSVAVLDFFYIHWFSYRIALSHYEDELYWPMLLGIFTTVLLMAVRLIERSRDTDKLVILRYILLIIIVAAVVATFFHGYCPACNEVHDPVYKYLFELVNGHEYQFAG